MLLTLVEAVGVMCDCSSSFRILAAARYFIKCLGEIQADDYIWIGLEQIGHSMKEWNDSCGCGTGRVEGKLIRTAE